MFVTRIVYAVMTWLLLWGFSGGDTQLFWSRLPLLALGTCLLALVSYYLYPAEYKTADSLSLKTSELRRVWLLRPSQAPAFNTLQTLPSNRTPYSNHISLKWIFAPLVLLVLVIASIKGLDWSWILTATQNYGTKNIFYVLCLIFFVSGLGFLTHALLQREWGLGNVVFLLAITLGFASQHLGVFALSIATLALFAFIAERTNIVTALVAQTVWFVLFFLSLGYLS